MRKTLTTILIVITTTLVLTLVRHKKQTKLHNLPQELVVGTTADIPPITFVQDNNIVGFDVDIVQEVARRMGKTVVFKDLPFETLLSELIQGNIHIIASGMSLTPEREELALFSKPYFTADPFIIITKKDGPKVGYNRTQPQGSGKTQQLISGLNNKTVVAIKGYTSEIFFSNIMQNSPVNIVYAGNQADALAMLMHGKADAFISTASTLKPILAAYPPETFNTITLQNTDQTSALVTKKERIFLMQEINKALSDMHTDGTIETFKQKWQLSPIAN